MRVLLQECVRYFEPPLCFRMPPGHVAHTSRCWDQEFHELRERLLNAESDVKSLEQGNKLLKQENFHLKEQISPSHTTSGQRTLRGQRANLTWTDELIDWGKTHDFGEISPDVIKMLMDDEFGRSPKVAVKEIALPDGRIGYMTSDGKRFNTQRQAQQHADLLKKGP